jgi:succinyl-CoA synthetase beta subunit
VRLTEDRVKSRLRADGLPVPDGAAASTPEEAARIAETLGGGAVVKAIIPTGRRGKAGAVHLVDTPAAAADAARAMIGSVVNEFPVTQVYVEGKVSIAAEYYLSFAFGSSAPKIVLSRHGGVEIEQTHHEDPDSVITADVDPIRGLSAWDAVDLWERAGVSGPALARLGQLTARVYAAFRSADALMIECNPIAADTEGNLSLVGAMMEVDDNALFRHRDLTTDGYGFGAEGRTLTERERAVIEANQKFPGGAVRYTELGGDIGIMMGGGGASLLQHDMIVDLGGAPANHTDLSPTPTIDKPLAVLSAILENPRVKGLLVSFNYLQLLPCTNLTEALAEALRRHEIDTTRFPVVIRVFGPKEDEARAAMKAFPGIHYMAPKASLDDAVARIVKLTRDAAAGSDAR